MIHFLLTSDPASALKLKRLVAAEGGRTDVIVGAWPELLVHACNNYIQPLTTEDWNTSLGEAVNKQTDAFWSTSLKNAATEAQSITTIIGGNLTLLLVAAGPERKLDQFEKIDFAPRLKRHIHDFAKLHTSMGFILPPTLRSIRQILCASSERALRSMRVYHTPEWPRLNPWQRALVDHLNAAATHSEDGGLNALLAKVVATPAGQPGTALRFLQENLFLLPSQKITADHTMQWLAVRDYLQEIEVTAGMIQEALTEESTLQPADIAILLPSDSHYSHAVRSVFAKAGIAVSGLYAEYNSRDLGAETLFNLLLSLDKPAPVTALATLLSSPLMPWAKSEGNRLAQEIVNLNFKLKGPKGCKSEEEEMLDIIRNSVEIPADLKRRLKRFSALLNRDETVKPHRENAQKLCLALIEIIGESEGSIPWHALKARSVPHPVNPLSSLGATREGVAVFYEGEEPWRKVRRLFVLGCFEGHYPAKPGNALIFTDADLTVMQEKSSFDFERSAERNDAQRQLFKRQLCSATDETTFLLPCRDAFGKKLSPSACLTFASILFTESSSESLVINLESSDERKRAHGLPQATKAHPVPLRQQLPEDLSFDVDLLAIGRKEDGSMKPESPSRLETLMVSPLAWLFERFNITPREWTPETLDILTKGTLAHTVFEHLFTAKKPLPGSREIETLVPGLFDESIREKCPYLQRKEWKVEREHIRQEILKAALQWGELLQSSDAKVISTEISLQGLLNDVPIHGNADLLLELADNRMVIVDYKKSSSGGRKKRMEKGYDHQAELYRTMIKTGGAEEVPTITAETQDALQRFRDTGDIGTLYYLMNDQTALANTKGWFPGIGGIEEVRGDASANAMSLIAHRISEVRKGNIAMNTSTDEKDFKKNTGITAYSLQADSATPLVRMFMKEGEETPDTLQEDRNA